MSLKLEIELVPSSSWHNNLRAYQSKKDWDRIRKKVYARAGHKCEICGAKGRLNCHELWEYDNSLYIQSLKGFIALCDLCHHVKHFGMTSVLAAQGKLKLEKVIEHFVRVNKCTRKEFEEHKKEAYSLWRKRSAHEWTLKIENGEIK